MPRQKSAKGFADDIGRDLKSQVEAQYGQLVRETINDLVKGTVNGKPISPVLTGFFASSWKASTTGPVDQSDFRKNYSPWNKIKTVVVNGKTVLAPGNRSVQKVRHYVPKRIRLSDTVYIGNTAEYSVFALESPKRNIVPYILGAEGLNAKIDRIFSDKNKPTAKYGVISDFSSGADYDREVTYVSRF